MNNPLALKLGSFIDLDDDDRLELDKVASAPTRRRAPTDVIRDGERSDMSAMRRVADFDPFHLHRTRRR